MDGVSVSGGQILRPLAPLTNNFIREKLFSDGTKLRLIVPSIKNESNYKKESEFDQLVIPYYTEYRVTVDEKGTMGLDSNEINSGVTASNRKPAISMVLGNYVGVLPGERIYGKILKPKLFDSKYSTSGKFDLLEVLQNQGVDEVDSLGLLFALHSHKSGAFMGIDKEGHFYQVLPKSSGRNSLGKGRSMSLLAYGNKKEVWGEDDEGNSWDLSTKGGVKWNIGASFGGAGGKSLDILASKGISIRTLAPAEDGLAKNEIYKGNVSEYVDGDKTITVTGTLTIESQGLQVNKYMAAKEDVYAADKTKIVNGTSSEICMKDKQLTCMSRKITLVNSPISPQGPMVATADEKEVMFGDIKESIKYAGSKKTSLKLGNIEDSIIAGSKKTSISLGSYSVAVKAGSVSINTKLGSVTVSGSTVSVKGDFAVTAKAPLISMNGSLVKLGNGAKPGVVTFMSHQDYVTGIPLRPSPLVWSA
jgi:hypothetical protein